MNQFVTVKKPNYSHKSRLIRELINELIRELIHEIIDQNPEKQTIVW